MNAQREQIIETLQRVESLTADTISKDDLQHIRHIVLEHSKDIEQQTEIEREFGLNPILFDLQTALITIEEIGASRAIIISTLLHEYVHHGLISEDEINTTFGADVVKIIHGLLKVNELYAKSSSVETENYRDLMLSFAEDMRVIFIIIADRVNLMRQIKELGSDETRRKVAYEASILYAPLAHKLGLYLIKSELEDLSLKYLETETFYMIKEKLNATKRTRDEYIRKFIAPIEEKLQAAGLKFHIKGRTKSIHSIWQKMQKQRCQFEGIYDLFAIRIILDSKPEKEKQDCWQVYSIVTDMYRPNPKRLRDWLSVPKSNGYESLHTTVMGPEGKWVEIQIRTERMDDIAEHGLAAHWRYKGVKDSGAKLEDLLKDIRSALETQGTSDEQVVDQFKVDLYSDEVFVFTPKGDLFKMPKGATLLDFAFQIHTNIGSHCSGGLVNGKNVPVRTKLQTGDQVEILTNPNQLPKRDWLNYAITSKARSKIRQSINEQELRTATYAKEMLERKFKNKKLEMVEPTLMKTIKRLGFKHVMEFYKALTEEVLGVDRVIDTYIEEQKRENNELPLAETVSASTFRLDEDNEDLTGRSGKDVLLIGNNIKGVEYNLAKCCNPIYGDDIVGFVTVSRGITIHRKNCPNCRRLLEQMSYRAIEVNWATQSSGQFSSTLHIVGNDDVGIVSNITSIIAKEKNILLRSIDIKSSEDGLFAGNLTVIIDDNKRLNQLIKKIQAVKGVKSVTR
ncbi:MAG: bifunctional (p)ppGpp synthetase/guanosine-3',5'-bis(diphosphate) 3'-pyrophosphohydrolase [Bacteroidaceae bacterium]|nr:bifunctional (p)ppGpp synthetase/guanosine-3',5'-bis(diphosphate) 3'-pyrophosphohydrolase [Bacteroidaceae bacterium]